VPRTDTLLVDAATDVEAIITEDDQLVLNRSAKGCGTSKVHAHETTAPDEQQSVPFADCEYWIDPNDNVRLPSAPQRVEVRP
jgi:hypothetical protein